MKKPVLILLFLLPALAASQWARAEDAAQQKFAGKIISNPERPAPESAPAGVEKSAATFTTAALSSGDVSMYNVWFDFTRDDDGDGYYHQFNVSFDLDTRLSSASVYVTGQLNNGASTPLFRTDPFTLRGATGSDSYQATVLLTEGYPSTQYALTLRVYDAQTNALLFSYGPNSDSELAQLYLEDVSREAAYSNDLQLFQLDFTLSDDSDGDGYYTQADIRIDADAPGRIHSLYGKLYLIDRNGQWIYLKDTGNFTVSNYSHSDAVYTGFGLDGGFDPQRYKLAVELYDAYTHNLLLTSTTPDAAPVRMESMEYDNGYYVEEYYYEEEHSGGSVQWLLLGAMTVLVLRRTRKERLPGQKQSS